METPSEAAAFGTSIAKMGDCRAPAAAHCQVRQSGRRLERAIPQHNALAPWVHAAFKLRLAVAVDADDGGDTTLP